MKCQNCGKNNATTHVRQSINGQNSEYWLCPECAEKAGLGGMFSGFDSFMPFSSFAGFGMSAFESLLGSMFGTGKSMGAGAGLPSAVKCSGCGSTLSDIAEKGMVGCAECYETFGDSLAASIERMHGRTQHNGKLPGSVGRTDGRRKQTCDSNAETSPLGFRRGARAAERTNAGSAPVRPAPCENVPQIEQLRAELKRAVEAEEYEKAAVLRDKIKELEAKRA